MLDVGGQDATEAFEDVGHSDEARETLETLLVGTLKRQVRMSGNRIFPPVSNPVVPQPGDPAPRAIATISSSSTATNESTGMGIGVYAIILVGGLLAYGAYQYTQ